MEKIIKYVIPAMAFFLLLCFFQTCGTKGKITDVKKQNIELHHTVDSLHNVVNSLPTHGDVDYIMEQVMYKYLIYEDDLDKGKISLSEIKNRIDE